jgi:hypothetical protein
MFKFDNTASVKKLAQKGIPPIPKGNESFRFNVGQTVISSGEGMFKKGTPFTIADRYMQHGYAYYRDTKANVHRDKDIS